MSFFMNKFFHSPHYQLKIKKTLVLPTSLGKDHSSQPILSTSPSQPTSSPSNPLPNPLLSPLTPNTPPSPPKDPNCASSPPSLPPPPPPPPLPPPSFQVYSRNPQSQVLRFDDALSPQTPISPPLTESVSPPPTPTVNIPLPNPTPPSLNQVLPAAPQVDPPIPPPKPALCRTTRATQPPPYLRDYKTDHAALLDPAAVSSSVSGTRYPLHHYVSYSGLYFAYHSFVHNVSQFVEPANYEQARHDPKWVAAMDLEI